MKHKPNKYQCRAEAIYEHWHLLPADMVKLIASVLRRVARSEYRRGVKDGKRAQRILSAAAMGVLNLEQRGPRPEGRKLVGKIER